MPGLGPGYRRARRRLHRDVDATDAFFSLKSITQHGSTAVAEFQATVDLAQSGQQWDLHRTIPGDLIRRPVDDSLDALLINPSPRRATGWRR